MKRFMWLIPVFIAALLGVFALPGVVFAATTGDIEINATPAYISIAVDPGDWMLNGLTGPGFVAVDTIYYANPTGDVTPPSATILVGECHFNLTNDSTVAIDIAVDVGDFIGGDAAMTNSDTGANGASDFGAFAWFEGDAYANKTVAQSTASADLIDSLPADEDLKWGAEIETRTNDWTGGSISASTMTMTASAD